VLNPAAARGPDGELYLFPRLVAQGTYSRIGIARIRLNEASDPAGVERIGIALEPEADYELQPDGSGGCEDPRITFVEPMQRYMMTYTALSSRGPRIALAASKDLLHWQRLGLATFAPRHRIEFSDVDDKDASLFPVAIPNPSGKPELAILHRPLFPGTRSPGDRVGGLGNFGVPTGEFGTVRQVNDDDAVVTWDDDGRIRVHQPSLKKL
jgi:beta-1,2-mannobiose phosphorylase / 1,2-beta-oligomannan phosphorylase